ncbi:MAG: SMP-30/gluconolactonase/LRE family protein [Aquabacterium sp.]|nr:SMP-30/gluconolactonase/LRE family protein [Aquabacterium sp.]
MSWHVLAQPACVLGEGVIWSPTRQAVMFVDIHGQRILQYDLATKALREWHTPQRVGWLIPQHTGERFLAGLQDGFALIGLSDVGDACSLQWLARPFGDAKGMRLNDAKADAQGRVWAGSLNNDDESQPVGALFCLTPDHQLHTVDTGYCVANGPAISATPGPNGHLFLHTDSARRTVYAFDLDAISGTLRNKRTWLVLADDEGYPDGMNFDAQGHVWLAHWGAACVSQYSAQGELLQRFDLPTSNVTNVAFGGAGLDRLFVTTARAGLTDTQLAAQAHAGALFEITGHGATGLTPLPFKG